MNDGACRYRITFAPESGRGSYRLQTIVAGDLAAIVDAGEYNFVRVHACEIEYGQFGKNGVLKVIRVERQELNGAWRDRRWPIPHVTTIDDLVFSKDGKLLSSVIPTWPE